MTAYQKDNKERNGAQQLGSQGLAKSVEQFSRALQEFRRANQAFVETIIGLCGRLRESSEKTGEVKPEVADPQKTQEGTLEKWGLQHIKDINKIKRDDVSFGQALDTAWRIMEEAEEELPDEVKRHVERFDNFVNEYFKKIEALVENYLKDKKMFTDQDKMDYLQDHIKNSLKIFTLLRLYLVFGDQKDREFVQAVIENINKRIKESKVGNWIYDTRDDFKQMVLYAPKIIKRIVRRDTWGQLGEEEKLNILSPITDEKGEKIVVLGLGQQLIPLYSPMIQSLLEIGYKKLGQMVVIPRITIKNGKLGIRLSPFSQSVLPTLANDDKRRMLTKFTNMPYNIYNLIGHRIEPIDNVSGSGVVAFWTEFPTGYGNNLVQMERPPLLVQIHNEIKPFDKGELRENQGVSEWNQIPPNITLEILSLRRRKLRGSESKPSES